METVDRQRRRCRLRRRSRPCSGRPDESHQGCGDGPRLQPDVPDRGSCGRCGAECVATRIPTRPSWAMSSEHGPRTSSRAEAPAYRVEAGTSAARTATATESRVGVVQPVPVPVPVAFALPVAGPETHSYAATAGATASRPCVGWDEWNAICVHVRIRSRRLHVFGALCFV
jgi:hypothetical protein